MSITESLKNHSKKNWKKRFQELTEEMSTKVDEYLNYVVENWMEENKLAVETGMRLQIAESFIDDLKGLFENHFIQVPDSKVNLLTTCLKRTKRLKNNLMKR